MALIDCPECGGLVSSEAKVCIHCGFPLLGGDQGEAKYMILLESVPNINAYIISQIAYICPGCEIKRKINNLPCILLTGISLQRAKDMQSELNKLRVKTVISKLQEEAPIEPVKDVLCCPRCKSTAITTGTKGYGLIRGFIGSNKTVNRCGRCGYSWEP